MLDILLVDDEPTIRLSAGDALRSDGHNVTTAADGAEALAHLSAARFDVVVTDVRMPKADGIEILRNVKQRPLSADVILMSAYAGVPDAVEAVKQGAEDYLTKPFEMDELRLRVHRIAARRGIKNELECARTELQRHAPGSVVGASPVMQQLIHRVETYATSDAPVLITGESGTGKELIARSIHNQSKRAREPFVAVNCAAFPETLLEAELFGHERGAFTGAVRARLGRFSAADKGTLFLDEIAEIPPMAQAKLLRVLQESKIEPLGTNTAVDVDVRVLSATHRNLKERIIAGTFREDLYYRLNVLDISIPPLRERPGDLPLLVEYFLGQLVDPGVPLPTFSPRAWAALSEYRWPGNVRELKHAIQRAVVLARGDEIDLPHLPDDIAGNIVDLQTHGSTPGREGFRPLGEALREFEREYLLRALTLAQGRKARAAHLLGISRKNLWEKLRGHSISFSHRVRPPSRDRSH
ncbi:MAG: sigma-54-dependent Fis family transcriptional regulator [Deltaproteobacteria bacterium]|nr:sigma-54-dependent Fis family transcriptional regulator [Deltaproteobacteria bacterium]